MTVSAKWRLVGLAAAAAVSSSTAFAKDLTFGYVAGSLKYPYNVATAEGFEQAAAEAGAKAIVLDPQGEVEKQGNAIDDLLAQGVDGIGFLPLDSVRCRVLRRQDHGQGNPCPPRSPCKWAIRTLTRSTTSILS